MLPKLSETEFSQAETPTEPGLSTSALLTEVATALLRLPFEGRAVGLHLRALRLKRQLELWEVSTTDIERLLATRESVLALRREAADLSSAPAPRGTATLRPAPCRA